MKNKHLNFSLIFLISLIAIACSTDPKKKDDESEEYSSRIHREYFDRHMGFNDR